MNIIRCCCPSSDVTWSTTMFEKCVIGLKSRGLPVIGVTTPSIRGWFFTNNSVVSERLKELVRLLARISSSMHWVYDRKQVRLCCSLFKRKSQLIYKVWLNTHWTRVGGWLLSCVYVPVPSIQLSQKPPTKHLADVWQLVCTDSRVTAITGGLPATDTKKSLQHIYMTADALLIPVLGICLQLNTKCFISENNSNISLEKAEFNLFWYVSFCHVMTACTWAVLAHINHIFPAELENVHKNRLL